MGPDNPSFSHGLVRGRWSPSSHFVTMRTVSWLIEDGRRQREKGKYLTPYDVVWQLINQPWRGPALGLLIVVIINLVELIWVRDFCTCGQSISSQWFSNVLSNLIVKKFYFIF